MSAFRDWFASLLLRRMLVCNECVRKTDRVVDTAGDFSCCERCQKSITSKTGKTVVPEGA